MKVNKEILFFAFIYVMLSVLVIALEYYIGFLFIIITGISILGIIHYIKNMHSGDFPIGIILPFIGIFLFLITFASLAFNHFTFFKYIETGAVLLFLSLIFGGVIREEYLKINKSNKPKGFVKVE
jgi:hypothetical protein